MANFNFATKIGYFCAGASLGAVAALLFAPKSGEETRKYIADKAEDGKDYAVSKAKELRKQAEQYVDKSVAVVSKQKEKLADALESGRHAARDAFAR